MTDTDPSAALDKIRKRAEAATPGPWWSDESEQCWRLHGVHARLPSGLPGLPDQVINHQILKAPKRGTTMAEYWPGEDDAAFIVAARSDVPRLLAAVDAVLTLADAIAVPHAPARNSYEGGYVDAERQLGKVFREEVARALTGEEAAP